jgi:2'-hydroxyisoflavone reductase
MTTRRHFLGQTAGLLAAGYLGAPELRNIGGRAPLRILILGGTGFIGPHMVRRAISGGHKVTLFNRGKSNAELFPDIETLIGDRDGKIDALRDRKWDAVIDNSGYVPRHVRDSAQLLAPNVGRYVFISTGSVYAPGTEPINEDSPLLKAPDPASEEVEKYYGELKVLCEEAVRATYGADRNTILRLHIVAGPGDPTHRFTYWPVRIEKGGEVLAPGPKDSPVQHIDVRDLADFALRTVEQGYSGTYNLAGPAEKPVPIESYLEEIRKGVKASATFTFVDLPFLAERKVYLPMAIPARMAGLAKVSPARAVAKGLKFRPISETAADTLAWYKSAPAKETAELKIDLERDANVLREWKAKK